MNQRVISCPQCGSTDVTTKNPQVRCGGCGWSIQDSDPSYTSQVAGLLSAPEVPREPILEAVEALPNDFGASLTTARSALPADHPVHGDPLTSLTAAEFRNRREQFGLSAEWLAERLGVALKTVQRWENGHRPIPEGVVSELDQISTAVFEVAARRCAEELMDGGDLVMVIPRTGDLYGFPASWYRALVDIVRDFLRMEYGEAGNAAAAFRVVYRDELGDES